MPAPAPAQIRPYRIPHVPRQQTKKHRLGANGMSCNPQKRLMCTLACVCGSTEASHLRSWVCAHVAYVHACVTACVSLREGRSGLWCLDRAHGVRVCMCKGVCVRAPISSFCALSLHQQDVQMGVSFQSSRGVCVCVCVCVSPLPPEVPNRDTTGPRTRRGCWGRKRLVEPEPHHHERCEPMRSHVCVA